MKILVDGHCDTLSKSLDEKSDLENKEYCFNLVDANKKTPCIQMMAAYIAPKFVDNGIGGFNRAINILEQFKKDKDKSEIINILNKEDLNKTVDEKKIGIILTIENGSAISGNIENIEKLYEKGIRVMSVTWNEDNRLGCGALTKNDEGLTKLGEEYIRKLEEKNILIDVSHSSEKTFWDITKCTNRTIVATHSCVNSICNHPRNLKDEQIIEIANREGIIGICFASHFLNESGKSNVVDIINHIKYIKDLVGIDYIGLGSDFDGVDFDNMPSDIRGIKDINKLEEEMKMEGFTEEEINKVMGENWLRVLRNIL